MSDRVVNPWSKPPRSLRPTRVEVIGLAVFAALAALVAIPTLAPGLIWPRVAAAPGAGPADLDNGAYLADIAGCVSCHTAPGPDAVPLAGGRRVPTPFGSLIAPNITPHPDTGIGGWSLADFATAIRRGRVPDGGHLYPAFPYTAYAGLAPGDIRDLKAHLDTVAPADRTTADAHLPFPLNLRPGIGLWKLAFFRVAPIADTAPAAGVARGRYLAEAVAHCGACHTPLNRLGGPIRPRHLAGTGDGGFNPDVPNITPHEEGIGAWSRDELIAYLETGLRPDGQLTGGAMLRVIEDMTAPMSGPDRAALADYLRQVPPLPSR